MLRFPKKVVQYVQGFSIYQNTLKLFNTDSSGADSVDCINGIRWENNIYFKAIYNFANGNYNERAILGLFL